MLEKNGINAIRAELSRHLDQDDVDFICGLIRTSDDDENLFYFENDAYNILDERGLWKTVNKAVESITGSKLVHSNLPVR